MHFVKLYFTQSKIQIILFFYLNNFDDYKSDDNYYKFLYNYF